ncbi:MAG: hypothetical protein ACT4OO_05110 [Nitrospiraceae bacterium]
MNCTRCEGLMVGDHLLDLQESGGPMWVRGWRCVACGNIEDSVISRHRVMRQTVSACRTAGAMQAEQELDMVLPLTA